MNECLTTPQHEVEEKIWWLRSWFGGTFYDLSTEGKGNCDMLTVYLMICN